MKKGSSYLLTEAEKEEPFSLPQLVHGKDSYLFPAVKVASYAPTILLNDVFLVNPLAITTLHHG